MKLSIAKPVSRSGVVARASQKPSDAASRNLASLLAATVALAPSAAYAEDSIDTVVNALTGGIQMAGDAAKVGYDITSKVATDLTPVVKDVITQATPVVNEGIKVGSKVLSDAATAAQPVVVQSGKDLANALKSSGVNPDQVKAAVNTVEGTAEFLSKQDPTTLAEGALALLALYFLSPVLGDLLKGYKGDLTAPQALDLVMQNSGSVLIDLRSVREKESAGLPDVPASATNRYLEIEIAQVDKRVRGLLRDPSATECELTSLQIADLKRISTGSPVVIMDAGGSQAKIIAKSLARKGFGNVYVMKSGFRGWQSANLETKFARTVFNPTVVVGGDRAGSPTPRPSGRSSISGSQGTRGPKSISAKVLPPGRD